jgi:hypothetical protein
MSGDTGSARHSSKDEAEIRLPVRRLFPRTEGQAKFMVILIGALFLSGIVYLVLRGFGLTNLFSE